MSARLDAVQLDQAWDALVGGNPLPETAGDAVDREMLDLLAGAIRPSPSSSFVQSLERKLALAAGTPEPSAASPLISPIHKPISHTTLHGWWRRPPSRWMTAGYALAAIALIVLLSTGAIVRQRDHYRPAIPAVSDWSGDGPPTSSGVEIATLFAHAFTPDELTNLQYDQWGWIELTHGAVPPGMRSQVAVGTARSDRTWAPGVSFIEVESGSLEASLKGAAVLSHGNAGGSQQIDSSTDVTLNPGDTLMFGTDSLAEIWNPGGVPANYVSGGLYGSTDYPVFFPDTDTGDRFSGIASDRGMFSRTSLLDLSVERISIAPGESYAYSITPTTLLLANFTKAGLQQSRWIDGVAAGRPQSLSANTHVLHADGDGYYTLTNTGAQTVDVYLLRVAPTTAAPPDSGTHVTASPSDSNSVASVQTLFDQFIPNSELAQYQPDQWGWVEFVHAEVDPGTQWPVIDGSNATPTPGWPGLSVVAIRSGQLAAKLSGTVLVSRANSETMESVSPPAELVLSAGDAVLFQPGALESVWNRGSAPAEFHAGGLYDRPHYASKINDASATDTPGGSSFDTSTLAGMSSIKLSIKRVSIAPGEAYSYTISPQTLLLADVTGVGLRKSTWIDGKPAGTSQPLLVSKYTLHNDGPGDYALMSTGSEPVVVYIFEVTGIPPASSTATPSVPATAETLFTQTLNPDELATRQSDNWNWIAMTQGTMQPGDRAVIVEGSPEPSDVGFNGLGFITVTSGELVANAAAGATVQRGATGTSEPVDRSGNVTLGAGDTLIVPPSTLPAIWNSGDSEATYVTAGVYTASNITPLNEMDSEFARSGIRIDPNDLNVGEPVTLSIQQVSIPPGESFTYTVSSETWLEAVTQGGDLEQVKRIDGAAQGNAKTLVPSIYSLHMDGFGDYTLTNDGTEMVDVSFFRVEAQGSSVAVASPAAGASPVTQAERLVDQTLTPDQLAGFRIDDWKWVEFDRNVVPPQGDGQTFASLGKIPGQNPVPGLNLLAIESGTLVVAPDAEVMVMRGLDGTVESSPANTELTLSTGDALLYPSRTGGTFWNPSDTDTVVIGGGGYIRPAAPTFKLVNGNGGTSGAVAGAFGTGIDVTPGEMPSSDPVSIAIERITISPDAETELMINPTSWVVAVVEQGDLESTTTATGGTPSAAIPLRQGEITLPPSAEPQTVTLRNTGSDEAVIYVMRIGQ